MTEAVDIKDIQAQHSALFAEYVEAHEAKQDAEGRYAEKKAAYCKFNNKYGRILELMKED